MERDGTILARLTYEDGEGYVAADVEVAEPEPLDPLRDRFWIPLAPAVLWAGWDLMNAHGRVKYEALKPLGAHPWQRAGYTGRDLPDHGPATSAPAAAHGQPAPGV